MPSAKRSLSLSLALFSLALPGLALSGLAALPQAAHAAGDGLDGLRWKARPVVILSDRRGDPRIAEQKAALEAGAGGARSRAIAVLSEDDGSGALHRRLGIKGFAVVLVGKDGGVKSIWRQPVDAGRLFTVIDAMPMRREEMSR